MTEEEIRLEQAQFITKVYGWMAFALVLTGLTAVFVASSPALVSFIFGNQLVFWGLIIGELLLVGYLSVRVAAMSANTATFVFLAYACLNGLTMASIFLIYSAASIASTFLITAGTFGLMSFYGYYTKRDLTTIGNLCFMALIGLVIASLVNIFFLIFLFYWITTYAGILIFVGLVAYDTQKIKQMNIIGNAGTDEDRKEAVMGALSLYLDFINLFLFLLRIFGGRNND